MMTTITSAREALHRQGWAMAEAAFVTHRGSKVWLVAGRLRRQSFSVQSASRSEAWRLADRLVRRLQPATPDEVRTLRFPRQAAVTRRAA